VLQLAAMSGNEQVVAQLITAKANVHACDKLVDRTVPSNKLATTTLPNMGTCPTAVGVC
jgi:hypothetical protein